MLKCGAIVGVLTLAITAASAQAPSSMPTADAGDYLAYQPDASAGCRDVATLKNGTLRAGKVLEWATHVRVYDAARRVEIFDAQDIEKIDIRPAPARHQKPPKPDLTVAHIERLPRDPGWHGKVSYDKEGKKGLGILEVDPAKYPLHPAAGQQVRFIVHVKNAGGAAARAFEWRIAMDDAELAKGRHDAALAAGAETTIEVPWAWQEGQHHVRVELDTGKANDEICEWNNTFVDPVRALTFFFCVSRNVVDGFSKCRNCVDSFSFEDWAQHHVRMMNRLFEQSIYPSSPQGILERVRVDKIIVVEDARDDKLRPTWEPQRRRNGDPNEIIEYNGNWEFGKVKDDKEAMRWASRADWALLHELGHQLGLIDIYQYNTETRHCLVRDAAGRYVERHHFFPWPRTMMHWHGPHPFSEVCAGYLNKTLGRPRGYYGDYQYDVPAKCVLEVRGNDGRSLAGVRIEIFQRQSEGELAGYITGDPIVIGQSDASGRLVLPNREAPPHETVGGYKLRPNPFGKIDVVGGNGLMLARLSHNGPEEYHFLRLFDFNVAYLRGQRDEYVHVLQTRFAHPDAPGRIDYTRMFFDPKLPPQQVLLRWPHWGAGAAPPMFEYRTYQRTSNGGDETKPWTLVDLVPPSAPAGADGLLQPQRSLRHFGDEFRFDGFYSKDTWLSATIVSPDGREGALSDPVMIPKVEEALRMAVDANGIFYIPVCGNPDYAMLFSIMGGNKYLPPWVQPFGLRTARPQFNGYRPAAVGAAVDAAGLLVVADAVNHQIAWYDKGDLVRLVGRAERRPDAVSDKDGEFNGPCDVAVDGKGRVYVADRGNHRIQVLDKNGTFLFTFGKQGGEAEQFQDPIALGFANGQLTVTDYGNKRLQIFDVSGEKPAYRYSIMNLKDPDRGLVAPSGRVYLCDKNDKDEWAIVIYPPGAQQAERSHTATHQGVVRRPRGLYYDGKGHGYFANGFPIQWGRLAIE